nr:membrane protein insertion efficiency factor YidD [Pseudovibrio stylochi]
MNCHNDNSRQSRVSFPARLGLLFIIIYRYSLSLFMGRTCRYAPTCSEYTATALKRYGLWKGGWVGLARILRCRPNGASGFDPVPQVLPSQARWYAPWRYGDWRGDNIDPKTRLD